MPTGYTAKLSEGPQEFSEFVMTCARAFGYLVEMRERPMDAKIPEEFGVDPHYAECERTAREEYGKVERMTEAECDNTAKADYERVKVERIRSKKRHDEENARYEEMEAKVKEWNPPTSEHNNLRDFMLQQLNISKSMSFSWPAPKLQTGKQWRKAELARLKRDIEYYEEQYRKAVEAAHESTVWVKALRESLR